MNLERYVDRKILNERLLIGIQPRKNSFSCSKECQRCIQYNCVQKFRSSEVSVLIKKKKKVSTL
ncbi:hypothetical protein CsatB_015246 [Cannabis sativa]